MTAFLPTLLPADKPDAVPDEIALVFYESKKTHARTFESVAGRAARMLHRPLFEPGVRTDFPRRLGDELVADQPYYLVPGRADWYLGSCHVLVGTPAAGQDANSFRTGVLEILHDLKSQPPPALGGAIVSVSDGYLVYWEHWAEPGHENEGAVAGLSERVRVVLLKEARPAKIPADFDVPYDGLEIASGDCLNVRFVRRRLFPR